MMILTSKPKLPEAPKDVRKNLAYRKSILSLAVGNQDFQHLCHIRCKRDPIWYIDTFGWTYSPKEHPKNPIRPFILWDYQEAGLKTMLKAVGNYDILGEKSRDMGFTWLFDFMCEHLAHFHQRQSILMLSRKEDLVDGNPDSLMWKVMLLISHLPAWLQPAIERKKLEISFPETNSIINGESTNSDAGRGGRRTLIGADEFPAVDNGWEILRATRDTTNCRILFGTPRGASGAYFETREKMARITPERILRFHWSQHPEKKKGLYTTKDGKEGSPLKIIDTEYKFPEDYPFILDGKMRSVWYDGECSRATNQQEIAQELDIDYAASGWQFFDSQLLERLIQEYVRKPLHEGEIVLKPDWKKPEWHEQTGARVKLWFHPEVDDKVPATWDDVVCGVDTATGKGGEMSSNSVASFARRSTGEKIAEFVTNQMSAPEFCLYVLGLCRWFNNAYLIWEENGPGGEFTKQVKETEYRNVFYRNDNETQFRNKKTRKPGWYSTKETKRILLSDYGKALMSGKFINRSIDAINECREYVHQPNGVIEHARSKATIDPTASGENHGDRVISDSLACRGIADIVRDTKVKGPPEPPPNSFGGRRLAWEKERNKAKFLFGGYSYER